jgi:hypothetical protein
MKYILTFFFIIKTVIVFGQTNIDYGTLQGSWTEARIMCDGKLVQLEFNKGGFYKLNIGIDTTVNFDEPFQCGLGYSRRGSWMLNKSDSLVTFLFTKRVGYLADPGTKIINATEIYKIKKLTSDELVLENKNDEKLWAFIRIRESKE